MKTIEVKVGQKISGQRKAVGLTQAELAERVDVQPETISRIENGKRTPSLKLLARLSVALDLELHEMFRLHDRDNPKDRAVERLLWFASRLSPAEIDLVTDVGAAMLRHARRARPA
jgi:transcriptional regulator with XRE-family HTH domain